MLNEDTLFAYWESQNPRVDIRMLSDLKVSDVNITVFWGKDPAAFSKAIADAKFFQIGEQDWISRDQMALLVAVK